MSDSVRPHRQQPTRLRRPWDSPGKNTGVGCHLLLQCMKVKSESEVSQPCPTLSDLRDCSLPGSSAHGIFPGKNTGVGCHLRAELRIQSSSYGTVECKLLGRGRAWARDQAHMGKAKRDHEGSWRGAQGVSPGNGKPPRNSEPGLERMGGVRNKDHCCWKMQSTSDTWSGANC